MSDEVKAIAHKVCEQSGWRIPPYICDLIEEALRSYGDERAAQEREKLEKEWASFDSTEKPADWDTAYGVTLTGKTLEAMQHLAAWALRQELPPYGIIAASDHVFMCAELIRKDRWPLD